MGWRQKVKTFGISLKDKVIKNRKTIIISGSSLLAILLAIQFIPGVYVTGITNYNCGDTCNIPFSICTYKTDLQFQISSPFYFDGNARIEKIIDQNGNIFNMDNKILHIGECWNLTAIVKKNRYETIKYGFKVGEVNIDPYLFSETKCKDKLCLNVSYEGSTITSATFKEEGFNGIDTDVNTTKPEIDIYYWDREGKIQMKIDSLEVAQIKDESNITLLYNLSDKIIRIYPKTNSIEYEVILHKVPQKNYIDFLLNYSNIRFSYQPALNDSINNTWCNETDCWKGEFNHRPIEVVGSYAIFSNDKSGNQYTTGKIGQIYRPQICDNNSNCIWGKLNITKNILRIEIDKNWLDNAKYPITVDPTFGRTDAGLTTFSSSNIQCGNYTAIEKAKLRNMSYYIYDSTSGRCSGMSIYNDSTYKPYTLVTVDNGTHDCNAGPGWRNDTLNIIVIISAPYWLCAWSSGGLPVTYYYDADTTNVNYYVGGTFENWPSPWPGGTERDYKMSVYATYDIPDSTPPQYNNNMTNNTNAGVSTLFSINITDNLGLDTAMFSFDNCTGSFVNNTAVSFSGQKQAYFNNTKFVSNTFGCTVRWCIYLVDNDTNENSSCATPFSYVTTDTIPPSYSNNMTNTTGAGQSTLYSLQWNEIASTGLKGYIASWDNCTGSFVNNSWVAFSGLSNYSNFTKWVSGTLGCTIRWRVYANDSNGNWNMSQTYSYTTNDCREYTSSGSYTLGIDSYQTGNCIVISTSDIIFDCQGKIINSDAYAIYKSAGSYNNITLKNCNITAGSIGSSGAISNSLIDNMSMKGSIYWAADANNNVTNVNTDGGGMHFESTPATGNNWVINVSIKNCGGYFNDGLTADTGNINAKNVYIENCYTGVDIYAPTGADTNQIWENITIKNTPSGGYAFYDFYDNGKNIINLTIDGCADSTTLAYITLSKRTNITGLNITNCPNSIGITFSIYSSLDTDYNYITNSTITAGTCIKFWNSGAIYARYNYLYNNIFNCATPIVSTHNNNKNYLSVMKTAGSNIYNSSIRYIGGNYWTNAGSTGYSDTCTDADYDGFCDIAYTPVTNNTDSYPISDEYWPGAIPNVTSVGTNFTKTNTAALFYAYWQAHDLNGYIFQFDNGNGTLINNSWVSFTGVANWSNITKTITTRAGTTFRWRIYVNSTAGAWSATSLYTQYIDYDINISLWSGSLWTLWTTQQMVFICEDPSSDCEPQNQNAAGSQCILRLCNNGTIDENNVYMRLNNTCIGITFKEDDDYTPLGATILNITYIPIKSSVNVGSCFDLCLWQDTLNGELPCYFKPIVGLS